MRRKLFAACVLAPAAALFFLPGLLTPTQTRAQDSVPMARPCDPVHCNPAWMDRRLRLNDIQIVGTAESYKQRPSKSMLALVRMGGSRKDAEALDFGQPSLAEQLDNDARALSFDVAYDPQGGLFKSPAAASMAMELIDPDYQAAMSKPGFKTIHVLDVDFKSSCPALHDCLEQVAAWSRAHPRHLPIVIALHTNDTKTPMPGATKPVAFDAAAFDALDGEIRAVFKPGEMIVPDAVQGAAPTLRDAVTAQRWPRLRDARGKVIFVLDDCDAKVKLYQGARKSLEGRAMFVTADPSSPAAAFVAIDDPVKDGAHIADMVRQGFIVRTRADDGTVEARADDPARRNAAFASGAQIVTTDFLTPDRAVGAYRASLQDNPRALCGAALGSEHCVGLDAPRAVAAR